MTAIQARLVLRVVLYVQQVYRVSKVIHGRIPFVNVPQIRTGAERNVVIAF